MVIVDSSVWIAYFKGTNERLHRTLDHLIDEDLLAIVPPVRLELILGCPRQQRAMLRKLIDALCLLEIRDTTWALAERLAMDMRSTGVTPGVVDILIAAAASENHALLWTLDTDLEPLFKRRYIKAFSL